LPKLKCESNPSIEYWLEVRGFCQQHKDMIARRVDEAIASELEVISQELGLDLDNIELLENPLAETFLGARKKETLH
jgi:hypothetical protein